MWETGGKRPPLDEIVGGNPVAGKTPSSDSSELGGRTGERDALPSSGASSVLSYSEQRTRNRTKHNSLRAPTEIRSYADDVRHAAEKAERRPAPCCLFTNRRARLKGLKLFYDTQLVLLSDYDEDTHLLQDTEQGAAALEALNANAARLRRMEGMLAQATFWFNAMILIAKIVASVLSNSLSVISTMIDSLVDLVLGIALYMTTRAARRVNPYEYPRGRNKLEPLTVIIVGIVMGVGNCLMIILSVQNVVEDLVDPDVDVPTIVILLVGTLTKAFLMVMCWRNKTPNSVLLAQDQRNDIITNLVALACGLVGTRWWLYADPIGAILVCTFVAVNWFITVVNQVPLLSGKAAPARYTSRILHILINHDERISAVDALYVYHHGVHFHVEAHVVLSSRMSLKEANAITEPLQIKLEKLPYVERAFLHCDYRLDCMK